MIAYELGKWRRHQTNISKQTHKQTLLNRLLLAGSLFFNTKKPPR
jgi:hypothetical protein